jgi:hypothetical protein
MRRVKTLVTAIALLRICAFFIGAAENDKPRLIVLTDIGGDPDDQQSMIRLMLCANEFQIDGLIASSSGVPGELKTNVVRPELIREIVEAYGKVRENLLRHARGYPTAAHLIERIKAGNPSRGLEAIGAGKDTDGSRWIINVVDTPDPRPVDIAIWGGQTDLAQALWRVREHRGAEGLRKFIAKLRVHDIDDQDRIVEWIWKEFPGLYYVLSKAPKGGDKRLGAYRGMYLGGDESLTSREWVEKNVRRDHGPLGALYPIQTWTAPNPHSTLKEGDTPSWFYFLRNGLNDPAHPGWGGWGGRFTNLVDRLYRDAHDTMGTITDARSTVSRWRSAFQREFQARMDWCVADSGRANHNPVAVLNGDNSRAIVHVPAKAGKRVRLSAEGSSDPDKNAVAAKWFIYREAGTFRDDLLLSGTNELSTSFVAPQVSAPATVHVILEVIDAGEPKLSSFRRALVTIKP